MTANKLLTAAMNRLASGSSTGMQGPDSKSQTLCQGLLRVRSTLHTHYVGIVLFLNKDYVKINGNYTDKKKTNIWTDKHINTRKTTL